MTTFLLLVTKASPKVNYIIILCFIFTILENPPLLLHFLRTVPPISIDVARSFLPLQPPAFSLPRLATTSLLPLRPTTSLPPPTAYLPSSAAVLSSPSGYRVSFRAFVLCHGSLILLVISLFLFQIYFPIELWLFDEYL